MAFVSAPNVVKAEIIFVADGQRIQNVHYYEPDGQLSPLSMDQLGQWLLERMAVDWVTQYPNTVTIQQVVLTDQTFQFAPGAIYTTGLPLTGTRSGAQLPNSVALAITKYTHLRGRNYRGRTYFGPLTEGDVTGHQVASGFISGLMSRFESLRTAVLDDETFRMVIVSREFNKAPREIAETTLVTSFGTDGYVDSQRRRLPGRGN